MTLHHRPSKGKILAIAGVILGQILVLAMVYIQARVPAWTGEEISLKTLPVDPRSLFRGNYALLDYEISRIPAAWIKAHPKPNQVVYVRLAPGQDDTWTMDGASLDRPAPSSGQHKFIRGRIRGNSGDSSGQYRVVYGIEAFFAPKEKALALEKELRTNALALVWLNDSGRAALKTVIPNDKR